MTQLHIQREALAPLEQEWWDLLDRCPSNLLFFTPLWHKPWLDGIVDGEGFCPLTVRNNGRLVGIAPIRRLGDKVVFGADPEVTDYLDFIAAAGYEKQVISTVLDTIADQPWKTLDLLGIPDGSPTLDILPALARERGYHVDVSKLDVSPQRDMPATYEEYVQSLDKKDRHELRRKARRLEQTEGVRYQVLSEAQDVAANLDDFFHLMRMSRDSRKADFLTPERETFFREMARNTAEKGYIRLFFMYVHGKPVSAVMSFVYGDRFYLYNSGFDPAYSHLSVGLLLKAYCIQYAIQHSLRCFDFLRGHEPYKYDLGGVDRFVNHCAIRRGVEG